MFLNTTQPLPGLPCDSQGLPLPPGSNPPPKPVRSPNDWAPYRDRVAFQLADLLYRKEQMPASNINTLLELWAATLKRHGDAAPFATQAELYETIDNTPLGEVKWQSFDLSYTGDRDPGTSSRIPPWMDDKYRVFYRDPRTIIHNMLSNPDFKGEIDYAPIREFSGGKRRLQNFMSGEWAWRQANLLSSNVEAQGSSFVPVILGSDKTTVSVATGQNDYYPLYCSIGNVHNGVRRAHRNAVSVIGFLAIPKTNRQDANDPHFRKFRRQLFHSSLGRILESLRPWMERPDVVRCGDGHFRKIFYGIGPYIADYPEQALVACIVQGWCPICMRPKTDLEEGAGLPRGRVHTEYAVREFELGDLWDDYGMVGDIVPFTNDFPRADIHELVAPDILHQLIKGTFKDHLVTWIEKYLKDKLGDKKASEVVAQIDRRIATVPPFSKLRHFHEGRGFKQWTGDDSKALMKVYLPAIDGLVPEEMVHAVRSFLEFCYLVRRDVQTEDTVKQIEAALTDFNQHREIFRTTGVRSDFSLPCQHSMEHYVDRIWEFAACNGLCSSITESRHITAVKEPWRRSNRYDALDQMLMTNQRLDKLAAARVHFVERGMLSGSGPSREGSDATQAGEPLSSRGCTAPQTGKKSKGTRNSTRMRKAMDPEGQVGIDNIHQDGVVSGPRVMAHMAMAATPQRHYPSSADDLAQVFAIPRLAEHIRRFLYHEINRGRPSALSAATLPLEACPPFGKEKVHVYHSAAATYYAPSDTSGVAGMSREHIRATPSWRGGPPRYDCVFVNKKQQALGLLGMEIARIRLFFSFGYSGRQYPCAAVHWFHRTKDEVDEDTGMWMVEPSFISRGIPLISVIHLDSIVRAAHLIGLSVEQHVSDDLESHQALDTFDTFYVNKYVDHHAFELLHQIRTP
ncbi:hypothetical protein C8Q79DRAFT_911798 [Trametes meyenii]|nr:hypothetical protein C8Q79DRAFT_911798 [Trametes meyenii]